MYNLIRFFFFYLNGGLQPVFIFTGLKAFFLFFASLLLLLLFNRGLPIPRARSTATQHSAIPTFLFAPPQRITCHGLSCFAQREQIASALAPAYNNSVPITRLFTFIIVLRLFLPVAYFFFFFFIIRRHGDSSRWRWRWRRPRGLGLRGTPISTATSTRRKHGCMHGKRMRSEGKARWIFIRFFAIFDFARNFVERRELRVFRLKRGSSEYKSWRDWYLKNA